MTVGAKVGEAALIQPDSQPFKTRSHSPYGRVRSS